MQSWTVKLVESVSTIHCSFEKRISTATVLCDFSNALNKCPCMVFWQRFLCLKPTSAININRLASVKSMASCWVGYTNICTYIGIPFVVSSNPKHLQSQTYIFKTILLLEIISTCIVDKNINMPLSLQQALCTITDRR